MQSVEALDICKYSGFKYSIVLCMLCCVGLKLVFLGIVECRNGVAIFERIGFGCTQAL